MYAIIATDSDIIDCVRKNIVDQLASSMGENVTDDMQSIEYIVDDVNDNEGCHVYLGFGISPAAAKEECIHNALACGLHADNIVHGYFPMTYFMVALIPNHDRTSARFVPPPLNFKSRCARHLPMQQPPSTNASCPCATRTQ